jgi:hypothetical protein
MTIGLPSATVSGLECQTKRPFTLVIMVILINFIGEALPKAFDPRRRGLGR